jgi:hypothetical protein
MARTVLFSNQQLAGYLNRNFEPAWEMVRPVPIVRIDFGDNRILTRTLHGNIASYVCTGDGTVVDILPGIYNAEAYTRGLAQIRTFAMLLRTNGANGPAQLPARLQQYHRQLAATIRSNPSPGAGQSDRPRDLGKSIVEFPVERAIAGAPGPVSNLTNTVPAAGPALGRWLALVEDSRRNETERRLLIHDRLADGAPVRPQQIKTWLYKTVLNTDLNDPDLGLGDVLAQSDVLA